jgi:uridine kinase
MIKKIKIIHKNNTIGSSQPIIIGISGGTGAGKTTFAKLVINKIGEDKVAYIQQDSYYKDQSNVPITKRNNINYDHPSAIDINLLALHLKNLKESLTIQKPIYDFTKHIRLPRSELIAPKEIILVEGILILASSAIRKLLDIKVYLEADADIRLARRIQRDINERDRDVASVMSQYLKTVKPMHIKFIEPAKKYADIIVSGAGSLNRAAQRTVFLIKKLKKRQYFCRSVSAKAKR